MIRAIAIDDEPVALEIIRMHLDKVPAVQISDFFDNACDALAFVRSHPVDLVFLDINMAGMNGLDFARQVPAGIQLVFTTAHTDYAVHGFDMAITDFLLKPISLQRFQQACDLVEKRFAGVRVLPGEPAIFIRDGYDLVRISLSELIYIKADDNYLSFVERDRYTLTRMTMNEALAKLPSNLFIRVHKSYIVNLAAIKKISEYKIIFQSRMEQIPVSRAVNRELKNLITTFNKKA